MSPIFLALVLFSGLIAPIPVWRLRAAGWSRNWLTATCIALTIGILVVVTFPAPARYLIPILVVAFLAPFVVGPERVTRLLRREPRGVVIDVTPRLPARPAGDPDVDEGPTDDAPATPVSPEASADEDEGGSSA